MNVYMYIVMYIYFYVYITVHIHQHVRTCMSRKFQYTYTKNYCFVCLDVNLYLCIDIKNMSHNNS